MLPQNRLNELTIRLTLKKQELDEYSSEILELFKMCPDEEAAQVVGHILEQLHMVTLDQLPKILDDMAKVAKTLLEDGERLAIVAMAYDSSADGSQTIIQLLKPKLRKLKNWKIFNTVPLYLRKGGSDEYKRFLLVDDFTGSGQTVLNRLKEIEQNSKSRSIEVEPHVCLLYGMEAAANLIRESGYNATIFKLLKAGLSGHFEGGELHRKLEIMGSLEDQLKQEIEGARLPRLGYNSAEAGFWIKDTNAPNSNFPIMWWPVDRSGKDRITIMERAEL